MSDQFATEFKKLTGNDPFPWQRDLYESWFSQGKFPSSCNIPTGLGKTSVIAVWLIALAQKKQVPKRLVYVVNRRTVVDQTTEEVEKYKANLPTGFSSLGISTLRGQFADNREWSADPSVPAVICGTVDMIGSRLLFCGYGLGFKGKPLHAGFLGQDVLIVHDEAHLEPAFQTLLEGIKTEQSLSKDFLPFHVMELTATSRTGTDAFKLSDEEKSHPEIDKRINAKKELLLQEGDEKKLAENVLAVAKEYEGKNVAVLIFVRKVEDVAKIMAKLPKEQTKQLTGTMRGHERDKLIESDVFKSFLPKAEKPTKTVYLVCTSAGEVGVNISADHLICDLSTFESMAQRFGRVNRFGENADTEITVIYPDAFEITPEEPKTKTVEDDSEEAEETEPEEESKTKKANPLDSPRKLTLAWLQELNRNASPESLSKLAEEKQKLSPEGVTLAFAPTPTILPLTDILLDRWVFTTIREKMPGRPDPEPYLHGVSEDQPPETQVAWREEVEELPNLFGNQIDEETLKKLATEILEEYELKPHEILKDTTSRIFDKIKKMKARLSSDKPIWIVSENGEIEISDFETVVSKDKERIQYKTLLLPPSAGGLKGGLLDNTSAVPVDDVADDAKDVNGNKLRERAWDEKPTDKNMRCVFEFKRMVDPDEEPKPESEEYAETNESDPESEDQKPQKKEVWYWCVRVNRSLNPSAKSRKEYPLQQHLDDAKLIAEEMVEELPLEEKIRTAIIVACQFHDLGKRRKIWQNGIGNREYPQRVLAKSSKRLGKQENHHYRHEFGSLLDIRTESEFEKLEPDMKELVLHLVAAHHGRARPHFPEEEAYDPESKEHLTDFVLNIARRFAKLQQQYGRWGLAYLESLVRAVDIRASQQAEKASDPRDKKETQE